MPGANDAIKSALDAERKKREAARRQATAATPAPSVLVLPNGTVAQVPPVSQQRVGPVIGFPTGIGYSIDVSTAYPYGNIGNLGNRAG